MNSRASIARALAAAFTIGDLDVDALVDRGSRLLGRRWRWLRPLARRVVAAFAGAARPRKRAVTSFLLADAGFFRAYGKYRLLAVPLYDRPTMARLGGAAATWNPRPLCTSGALADWLGVTIGELEWLADRRRMEARASNPKLLHYRYRALTKRGGQIRLIESPKPRLKSIQRRILEEILNAIPLHAAAHGFRRGRSITTFAAPHVGRRVVVKIDLQDFFPSIPAAQIQALFRTLGYPETVADLLAGLCTNAAPLSVWSATDARPPTGPPPHARWMYASPHLPQGAPTSPALANLCAYRLDCRLAGLASSAEATYTRYADDLAFSGNRSFERVAERFQLHACAIAMREGFTVHHRKTRIMRQGVRQRIAGVVVNARLNVSRADFDRLKATLNNCLRLGPQTQNRNCHSEFRAHLEGRISFVEMVNPQKGRRLRRLFDQIAW